MKKLTFIEIAGVAGLVLAGLFGVGAAVGRKETVRAADPPEVRREEPRPPEAKPDPPTNAVPSARPEPPAVPTVLVGSFAALRESRGALMQTTRDQLVSCYTLRVK